ncbi:MAG: Stage II sporulation protein E [uncultured Nocardioides sp.]|uniref:Stage II sporulation protein E n=1 Tax=uncultured Nocardioides sp. TaxID=198441 RepID=A0A6J4N397_9ACTN|nr:MAG: Stage II sporulation protein E [uncultured Nocardioides sp.]
MLREALAHTRLSLEELWYRYFALGGTAGLVEVDAFLEGLLPLADAQRDLLALAVNERIDDLSGRVRAPYTFHLRTEVPPTGSLPAVLHLVTGMHSAPPERLAEVTRKAGEVLGVELDVLLVDYEQETLRPIVDDPAGVRPQAVDTTFAGQSYRSVRALAHGSELWVPLLNGMERLGVLHVRTGEMAADDRVLQERCLWLGKLIGHLVVASSAYGDALDVIRRTRRRRPSAELLWNLLPPLTAGTDRVLMAAMMHPVYGLGGDAFDYDIAESTARVAVFDAAGHDLGASLTVASALSAYRSARHSGGGLLPQLEAVDEAVMDRSRSGEDFVTGVLAELDLHTGRLRYVLAGHPPPLLLRQGRLVKRLDHPRRPFLGIGEYGGSEIGTESLEADDWLLFYTDGITEARDGDGAFFGEDRLVDFLRREILAGEPAPETVRRLSRAIMRHQEGALQDDATVLLLQWTPGGRRRRGPGPAEQPSHMTGAER